jgi:hypothetical protein
MKEEAAEAAEQLKARMSWMKNRTARLVQLVPKLSKKMAAACVIQ